MDNFKYSVLMSVYYRDKADWLKESIDSMLNQTILTNDFVIIKDGPLPQELNEIISEYEIKYSDIFNVIQLEKNTGLGPALAIGVNKCKNDWIARMDSDDISRKDRIEKEYKIICENDIDIVGSNIAEFTDDIKNIKALRVLPEENEEIKKFAKKRNPFGHPSVMLKKDKVLEAGNYRNYYLCEDYDMWIRMIRVNANCYNVQDTLVYMRVSEDFYKRRGGIKYLKSILKFKYEQFKTGFYKIDDFVISAMASIIVCLLPNNIRDYIYIKILRK